MSYLWQTLLPFATDSTGICSMFADSKALIIGHDPSSSAVRGYQLTEHREDKTSVNVGLQINEMALILGDLDYYVEKYYEHYNQKDHQDCDLIVLLHAPVSSMINLDIRLCAKMLQQKLPGVTVLPMDNNGNRYYDEGLSMAYQEVLKLADSDLKEKIPHTVNLLGLNTLDYPDAKDRQAIESAVCNQGYKILSVFGMQTDLDRLKQSVQAEKNIVVSASGIFAARLMEEKWGIPYSYLTDFIVDWKDSRMGQALQAVNALSNPKEILIIGEQVSSNLLRLALKKNGSPKVTVSSWFILDEEIKRDGDFVIQDEAQLKEVLQDSRYDVVIGDPVFKAFWDDSSKRSYIELSHPPVAPNNRAFGGRHFREHRGQP